MPDSVSMLPPFPEDVPTHPLLIIDYALLKHRDPQEVENLWEAGRKLGFWYLKNHGADDIVDEMFALGEEVMALPKEEKMRFEQGDDGMSFGYKAAGANAVNASGERDTVEFLNIAKDDALAWPRQARRSYPTIVNARMESTIIPFVRSSLEVNNTLLEIFNDKLGLPQGTLSQLHRDDEGSGSEARIIRNPAMTGTNKQAIGSHTDFGTLSFLHNRLGGLQVYVHGPLENWQYVKPLPGHAICNIGDALSIFSGGILRSNLHRVVPPPGAQAGLERWSLVFFTRPGDSSLLSALTEESTMLAQAEAQAEAEAQSVCAASQPSVGKGNGNGTGTGTGTGTENGNGNGNGKLDTGLSTAGEWFSRRIKNQRINNRQGPETWMASRGTEQAEV